MTRNNPNLGVCIVVFDHNNKILLGERINSYKSGFFGLPGGKVIVNESLHQTALRELFEETGLKQDLEYGGFVKENQSDVDFIHFVFSCRTKNAKPQLCEPEKCKAWEWLKPQEVDLEILPGHRMAIELIQQKSAFLEIFS